MTKKLKRNPLVRLEQAKLCLDCEAVFSRGMKCPVCASEAWLPLTSWVPSIKGGNEPDFETMPEPEIKPLRASMLELFKSFLAPFAFPGMPKPWQRRLREREAK
ncbi:MAG: hypothetical protein JW882_13465 [Deltaproteobacteria bacterium]|nr:hypothetical protein [Deltaproteobacteria bacterium]